MTPSTTWTLPELAGCAQVFGSPGRRIAFAVTAIVVTAWYTIIIPYRYTQQISLANWHYLGASDVAWSVALGLALALVLVVQAYSVRRRLKTSGQSGTAGGFAFILGLLPQFVCCGPMAPAVMAVLGMSATTTVEASGRLHRSAGETVLTFLSANGTYILLASLVMMVVTAWWRLRSIGRGAAGVCTSRTAPPIEVTPGVEVDPVVEIAPPATASASKGERDD